MGGSPNLWTCSASSRGVVDTGRSVREQRGPDPPQRRRAVDPTLPHSNHAPARAPELPRDTPVSPTIRRNLEVPEFPVHPRRPKVTGASVPEASVDKDGDAMSSPGEVRTPRECDMPPPTSEVRAAQDARQRLFRALVLPPPDRAHYPAARLRRVGKGSRSHRNRQLV